MLQANVTIAHLRYGREKCLSCKNPIQCLPKKEYFTELITTYYHLLSGDHVNSSFNPFENFRWKDIDHLAYKEDGSLFKGVTRQVLFDGSDDIKCQLRYFEVAPGGHTTLECHDHVHVVMVIRGEGDVLLGDHLQHVKQFDVVEIGSRTWHQFQATGKQPLGFLCLVSSNRDRPHRPDPDEKQQLLDNPSISDFLRF